MHVKQQMHTVLTLSAKLTVPLPQNPSLRHSGMTFCTVSLVHASPLCARAPSAGLGHSPTVSRALVDAPKIPNTHGGLKTSVVR